MYPVHPETFELNTNDESTFDEAVDLGEDITSDQFGITGWNPWVPNPPPLFTNRNTSTFIPRAPSRIAQPAGQPGGGQNPVQQDRRLTRQGETVQIVLNGLLRNGDIIRIGTQDFRLSWIPPEYETADAPVGALFYDPTLEKLAYKRTDGVTQYFQFE